MDVWTTDRDRIRTEAPPINPYHRKVYDFAQEWLGGKREFLLQTSGSTGIPKTITLGREQMEVSARMTGRALNVAGKIRALHCLNVGYIAGVMMVVRALVLDWEITVVEPKANPLAATGFDEPFDFVAMIPLQFARCLHDPGTHMRALHCGMFLLGGAPVSLPLLREIRDLSVPVYQSYGMTETVSHVALRRLNGENPEETYQVLDGLEFGVDARSCFYVSGAVTNYLTVQTNDLVEICGDRKFRWLGRADFVINSGGVKIHLDKLDRMAEMVFYDMQLENNFFHWYRDDETLGQKLVLFMENEPKKVNRIELLAKFATQVSPYELPKEICFVTKFVHTPTGKTNKAATAQEYFIRQSYE